MFKVNAKKILFGVSGGIAAYKAVEWVSTLRKAQAEVTVVMTEAATKFVTPLTFAAISGKHVHTGMFDKNGQETIPHISLAHNCDLIIIAPATADTIAKLANGQANDLLSTVVLASKAKIIVFPAMNSNMYLHPATQANIKKLADYNYTVIPPDSGVMACGDIGPGRLPEWSKAKSAIISALCKQDLKGQHFLVTAGPTHEPLDPVRYLSNRSSGKMGYALAEAAQARGANVTLISGPSSLEPPSGIETCNVRTAQEMHDAVTSHFDTATIIIKAAAVSDYKPATMADNKIKKGSDRMDLALSANIDILKELGKKKGNSKKPILIGFAAESQKHTEEGQRKLQEKNLDLIVVNDIVGKKTGFQSDNNQVTLIARNGDAEELPLLSKEETAHRILDRVNDIITTIQ